MSRTPVKNILFETMTGGEGDSQSNANNSSSFASTSGSGSNNQAGNANQNAQLDHVPPQVSKISVRPPPFWRENPALWFKQLESQFITNGITASDTKFHIAVSALDTSVISQVSDVVMNPPVNGKYERLKQSLQDRFADSEEQRFRKLLGNLDLGDKKPSHLWREMRELAGINNFNEQMLRSLWLQRLPTQSQAILSAEDGNIDRLLTLADRIHDIFGAREVNALAQTQRSSVMNPSTQQSSSIIEQLCEQVSKLTTQVASLSTNNNRQARNRSRSRSANRSDRRSSSRGQTQYANCWYHHKFGNDARKCVSPCKFKKPADSEN